MNLQPKYNLYATLLDKYEGYINSSRIYNEFWGFSEDPELSEYEFEAKKKQSLLDTINRIPFESEAADKGTAFNEIVDCILLNKKSDKMEIVSDKANKIITATYKEQLFVFPTSICVEFSDYFNNAICQVYTDAILPTKYGDVLLYGYIDELMPFCVHDIKTTSKYKAGKFKNGWQHIVYPYCLNQSGNNVTDFEYNVAVISGLNYQSFTEHYNYVAERDILKLTNHVEGLIEFIELNKDLITDNKIIHK